MTNTHLPQLERKYLVVVIGGGTGIFPVTTALRHLPVTISTIIAVSDSGGSTGRIRDEFGFQPVGDLRQSLAALAEEEGQEWIRKLLLYRFEKGTGLRGHNLGNLILTALQDMTGSTSEALHRARQIFRLEGQVIPATTKLVDLVIHYQNGDKLVGEHTLDEITPIHNRINHVSLTPNANLNPLAVEAIASADLIIIGPGDFFASIMAALAPHGTQKAFATSKAKIAYICNLMTRATQTQDMTAADHVNGIEKTINKSLDTIIINTEPIPPVVLNQYKKEHEYLVKDDLTKDTRVMRASLLSKNLFKKTTVDTAHRSLLRHDSHKLIPVLKQLLYALT